MNAAEHARRASDLLEGIRTFTQDVAELSAEKRLELAVTGGFNKLNADIDFTVQMAQAHALTALALTQTAWSAALKKDGVPA